MHENQGKVVKGYKLLAQIGSGGFGAVYRAYQSVVDREVAVKIILPSHANDPEFVRNFEAEAHLVARLEHPFIVPLYDYWRDPDGAFLVMRYLPEGSLSTALLTTGPLSPDRCAMILTQVAAALDAAHRNSIVHRDIKPANILLDAESNAYLTDFGLAKDVGELKEKAPVVGSVPYLAPEVIRREAASHRSDIYSLGFVLYEMLTGHYAYIDTDPAHLDMSIFDLHLREPIPEIPTQPPAVNVVLRRATAKNPDERYQNAGDMAAAFRAALEDSVADLLSFKIPAEFLANPYKGLQAFEEADAQNFFGREALVRILLNRMDEDHRYANFLALVGPSGSGKSSVVSAGVIPALRNGAIPGSDSWFIVDMVPGSTPFEQLNAALHSIALETIDDLTQQLRETPQGLREALSRILLYEDDTLLLVIDHFEEMFTQVQDERERSQFFDMLDDALSSEQLRVILIMRADFYDRPMLHERLGQLFQERTQVVLPLTSGELTHVITRPAEQVGLQIEPELVAAIISDVREEAVTLPLLQYTLTEIFDQREGRLLTASAYRELGGIAGALAHRADELYKQLDEEMQQATEQIFLRLVTLGDGTEDTRRRVLRSELLSAVGEQRLLQQVLDVFGAYRLLTFDNDEQTREPTVEVAHEALIREWDRLRHWLDESRHDVRQQRFLQAEAREWQDADEDPSYLLRGGHLTTLTEWAMDSEVNLGVLEERFLLASIAQREREEHEEAERLAYERQLEKRVRQRQRYIIAVLMIAFVVGSLLTMAFFLQRQEAVVQAQNAETQQAIAIEAAQNAETQQAVAIDEAQNAETQQAIAIVEAQNAETQRADAEQARDEAATQQAIAVAERDQTLSLLLSGDAERAFRIGARADALSIALASIEVLGHPLPQTQRTLIDIALAPGERRIIEHTAPLQAVAISPDGRLILAGGGFAEGDHGDTALQLFDEQTGELIRRFEGHVDVVQDVVFSADGQRALSAGADAQFILWDVQTGQIIKQFGRHSDVVYTARFASDGRSILTASADGTMRLWDSDTGSLQREFAVQGGDVRMALFAAGDEEAISVSDTGEVWRWDTQTGEAITQLSVSAPVSTIALAPNNWLAAFGTERGYTELVSRSTGRVIRRIGVQTDSAVQTIAFSPDSELILTGGGSNILSVWDVETGEEVLRFSDHDDVLSDAVFTPDGRQIISVGMDQTARVWDVAYGNELRRFTASGVTSFWGLAVSWDGRLLAAGAGSKDFGVDTGGINHPIVLWDLETGQEIRRLQGHDGSVWNLDFSPDNRYLLSTARSAGQGRARLWDVASGMLIREFAPDVWVGDAVFSPNGRSVLIGGRGVLYLLDLETGQEIRRYTGHNDDVFSVQFSWDGQYILSGSWDSDLIVWDVETGTILQRFTEHNGITTGAWSLHGSRIVSTSWGGSRVLGWEAETGAIIQEISSGDRVDYGAHGNNAAIIFEPNDNLIMYSKGDNRIVEQDIRNGVELVSFIGHTDQVYGLVLYPRQSKFYSSSWDGTIREWMMLPGNSIYDWIDENRIVHRLSEEEIDAYSAPPSPQQMNLSDSQGAPPPDTPQPAGPQGNAPRPGGAPPPRPTLVQGTPTPPVAPHAVLQAQPGANRGEFMAGDFDLWRYEGVPDARISVRVVADNKASLSADRSQWPALGMIDPTLKLFDSNGLLIAYNDNPDPDEPNPRIDDFTIPEDGVVLIEVADLLLYSGGSYTLHIEQVLPED